ncbi:MAG: Coenzyme F420 hydrogenase/dehydrogenase, beta subunit C-terminal domain [Deltaproteobacteria bacterium]|nr:Coenzyme F420 hydrogenase/dehydrogenase, beta subunit C-terminal domain [Deltaproteobacteria bacterium]
MSENTILLRNKSVNNQGPSLPSALVELGNIVSDDLCHRCGSCLGICPTDVLGRDDEDYPTIKNLDACINCNLCVKVCPGDEIDFPKYYKKIHEQEFQAEKLHGYFQKAYLGHALDQDMRYRTTSGGVVTAIFSQLFSSGAIDGAIIVKADEQVKWRGQPAVVSSVEEFISGAKSKYVIAPTNEAIAYIRKNPGRYAVVGLPCQIHGLQKMQKVNKPLRDRIVLSFGIFCHAAVEHDPLKYIWIKREEEAQGEGKQIERLITRLGKHPGIPTLKLSDQSERHLYFPYSKKYRPNSTEMLNVLYRLYTPARCFTCFDATSELADISVGDPWMREPEKSIKFHNGYTFVLARTARGMEALRQAQKQEAISLYPLDDKQALKCNTKMAVEKRHRAFYLLQQREKQGLRIPRYNLEIPALKLKDKLKVKLNLLTHYFCFHHPHRLTALKLALSPLGYYALLLNHIRRRLQKR